MSDDNKPSLAGRAAIAGVVTSLLAGPASVWVMVAVLAWEDGQMPRGQDLVEFTMLFSLFAIPVGLVGAMPVAAINSLTLAIMAKMKMDGPLTASISGSISGVLVAPAGLHLFVWKEYEGYWHGEPSWFVLVLAITGALMGFIHWLIAIRPYRRWRQH